MLVQKKSKIFCFLDTDISVRSVFIPEKVLSSREEGRKPLLY